MATQKQPEFSRWGVTGIWCLIVACAGMAIYSYQRSDVTWGNASAFFTVFFGVVVTSVHIRRQENRK